MIPCAEVSEVLRETMRKFHHSPEVMICQRDDNVAVGFRVVSIPNPSFYGHADTEHFSGCKTCVQAQPNQRRKNYRAS